jgi:hypothetical protein
MQPLALQLPVFQQYVPTLQQLFTELLEPHIFRSYFVTQHMCIHNSQVKKKKKSFTTISPTSCGANYMSAFGLICQHKFC